MYDFLLDLYSSLRGMVNKVEGVIMTTQNLIQSNMFGLGIL